MSTTIQTPDGPKEIDVFDILPPDEGEIAIYYGRIGNGKTYAGTRNIIRDLRAGLVVYANWPLKWEGYDERKDKWQLILGVLGLKWLYFDIPLKNYHFWDLTKDMIDGKPCKEFADQLAEITDASIHLDEGHIPFDSYEATKMSQTKRSAVFAMRHYDRRLTVYTQRANSVHVNLRGNANRFYKCEKTMDFKLFGKRFIHFLLTEFQDLTSAGAVDESLHLDEEGQEIRGAYKYAVAQWRYWGRNNTFHHFDTKYLRKGAPHYQENYAQPYFLPWKERVFRLIHGEPMPLIGTPPLPPLDK